MSQLLPLKQTTGMDMNINYNSYMHAVLLNICIGVLPSMKIFRFYIFGPIIYYVVSSKACNYDLDVAK
jgi:hypothetical protein